MKIPLSWLREFAPFEVEPQRLADDLTAAGLAVDAIEKVGDETVLELDITTNRVDCMNVYGVAREVAALYGLPLRPLDLSLVESGPPAAEALDVVIEAKDLCGRFCARLFDVRVAPVARLAARPAGAGGHPFDQQRRRPHELRDDRDGAAEPRLRPVARAGRPAGRALVASPASG